MLSIPAAMEPVGSPLYSQKPSDLAHSKESAQPEALRGISQTCCFSTIHIYSSSRTPLEDHLLSADPNCFTENVFFRNLKDSPRCADAENNQHGTTDGVKGTKILYTWEATNFLCWETRKFYQHFNASIQRLLSFPEHCDCHRMCRRTEALCVLRLPC